MKKPLQSFGVGGASPAAAKAAPKAAAPAKAAAADDDDDVDLFGSDDEVDEEADKARQERLAAYAAKKSKSKLCHVCLGWPWTHFCYRLLSEPALVAKSNVILDVKPWDDETDMKALETAVRSVQMDGLMWGVSKLVPLAYGIHKLQIVCVVEDEKGKVLFCFWFD